MKAKAITIEEMRQQYPDQWVLIGDPVLDKPEIHAPIVDKLLRGVVLYASKDKREIGYMAKDVKKGYESTACIFTGEIKESPQRVKVTGE